MMVYRIRRLREADRAPYEAEDVIEDMAQIPLPWPSSAFTHGQKRLQELPLRIAQIAGIGHANLEK
jgi:hypothetical protein